VRILDEAQIVSNVESFLLPSVAQLGLLKTLLQKQSKAAPEMSMAQASFVSGRIFFFLLGIACTCLVQALLHALQGTVHSGPAEIAAQARPKPPVVTFASQHKPWGDIEYTKLPLEPPDEVLPDTTQPLAATRWFFSNQTPQQVVKLFETCQFTQEQREKLFERERWQTMTNGVCVFPPSNVVLEMSRPAREQLYSILRLDPVNSAQSHPFRFRPENIEEWFAETGLGTGQVDVLRKLLYTENGALSFCDGALVQGLFSTNDFKRLVKALYGEKTFLMRLRITPETDIDGLLRYWGWESRARAKRPLLESIAQVPGGGTVGIGYLLPLFARERLYTYANPAADPKACAQNCFWTAMNFFTDKPDNRFLDLDYVQRVLACDYERVVGTPLYRDIITLLDSRNTPIHMSVYLADDVVFTKNGRDSIQPWVLMKLPDMIAGYQARSPVQVAFYRLRKS